MLSHIDETPPLNLGWLSAGGAPWWANTDAYLFAVAEVVTGEIDWGRWFRDKPAHRDASVQIGFLAPESPPYRFAKRYGGADGGVFQWNTYVDDADLFLDRTEVIAFVTDAIVDGLFEIGRIRRLGPPPSRIGELWDSNALKEVVRNTLDRVLPEPTDAVLGVRDEPDTTVMFEHPADEVRLLGNEASSAPVHHFITEYRQSPMQTPKILRLDNLTSASKQVALVCIDQASEIMSDIDTPCIHVIATADAAPAAFYAASNTSTIASILVLDTAGNTADQLDILRRQLNLEAPVDFVQRNNADAHQPDPKPQYANSDWPKFDRSLLIARALLRRRVPTPQKRRTARRRK